MAAKGRQGAYKFPCLVIEQGNYELVCFVANAKTIWEFVTVNRNTADKVEGYQRALSQSRVKAIAKYINAGNCIPNSILIALDADASLSERAGNYTIEIPKKKVAGWVIDG